MTQRREGRHFIRVAAWIGAFQLMLYAAQSALDAAEVGAWFRFWLRISAAIVCPICIGILAVRDRRLERDGVGT